MNELTPEELDRLLELEAQVREQEERKFEILYRLEVLPANDPRWGKILQLLEGKHAANRLQLESGG